MSNAPTTIADIKRISVYASESFKNTAQKVEALLLMRKSQAQAYLITVQHGEESLTTKETIEKINEQIIDILNLA